jgi:Flp pilus assembly protein TadG
VKEASIEMEMKDNRPRTGLLRDKRGAVLAEFVVVLVPLLTTFFVFLQLSAIAVARLRFKHGTVVAARAAAVYANGKGNCPECNGDGKSQIEGAARAGVGNNSGIRITNVEITDLSTKDDSPSGQYHAVTVKVTGRYTCGVPLGKLICTGMRPFVETKSMPHQGARYTKE